MKNMSKIEIYTEFITLGQFLKLAAIIDSGGEAKSFILNNTIVVNGEKEDRRGRKLRNNDIIEISGKIYQICEKNADK